MTPYESKTFCQISIAESQSKISLGNDGGYINMGMTTHAASTDGKRQLIVFIALMKKVAAFMNKNGPKPAQIHESTLKNDCPATVLDVRRLIKIDLSNTFIFDDEQDPPPTQASVTNIFLQTYSRVMMTIQYVDVC